MKRLLKNIRFYVLCSTFLLSWCLYFFILTTIPAGSLQTIRLTQVYALLALTYLYITLMATPVTRYFTFLPFRSAYIKSRRAFGLSAFYFGSLHATIAFFGQLGGFGGLAYLSQTYLTAITLSFLALFILLLMAATSSDAVITRLTFRRWKMLHRLVYVAGIFILIHALMLGTHFANLSNTIPLVFFTALTILFLLEAIRFDIFLRKKFPLLTHINISLVCMVGLLSGFYVWVYGPNATNTLGIHSQHSPQAMNGMHQQSSFVMPGMDGDRTRRYAVSFTYPDEVVASQSASLAFSVFEASSGNNVVLFKRFYDKLAHLIIVDSSLSYFAHVHPEQRKNSFVISHTFPKNDVYHVYIDFQPFGAIEQQFGYTINVGNTTPQQAGPVVDQTRTRTFGKYVVTMSGDFPLNAAKMTRGEQLLQFTFKDARSGDPVTNLQPYLGSFGHLVMIREQTYEYMHIHPADLTTPRPGEMSGPKVAFRPMSMYDQKIKSGRYRIFGQFNPGGEILTVDFAVEIQ